MPPPRLEPPRDALNERPSGGRAEKGRGVLETAGRELLNERGVNEALDRGAPEVAGRELEYERDEEAPAECGRELEYERVEVAPSARGRELAGRDDESADSRLGRKLVVARELVYEREPEADELGRELVDPVRGALDLGRELEDAPRENVFLCSI